MLMPILALLIILLGGCASPARKVAGGIFSGCEKRGHSEASCVEQVGCVKGQTKTECLRSFQNRHSSYINY